LDAMMSSFGAITKGTLSVIKVFETASSAN
jgi:hypothetical protein